MPLSDKDIADVLRRFPKDTPPDVIDKAVAARAAGTPLEKLWEVINTPVAGSKDALVPAFRHEHGADEGFLRKTAEDLGASLTTPLNAGLGVLGFGAGKAAEAGMLGISKGARLAEAALQAPMVAEGVKNVVSGETPGEKLAGALEAGFGAHGVNGAMTRAFDPKAVTAAFVKERGLPAVEPEPFSPQAAMKTADDYAAMSHAPNDPAVKASYDALKKQIADQFIFLRDRAGLKMEPSQANYPSSQAMVADVKGKNHLNYFPSDSAYGPDGAAVSDHPLLQIDPKTGLSYNDMFRAVHDYFGHAVEGNQFGPKGEQAAFNAHRQTLAPDALGALASETKGQNSFVNFGPHMRDPETGALLQKGDPRFLPPQARPFADQKAGLLPEFAQPGAGASVAPAIGQTLANAANQSPALSPSEALLNQLLASHATGGSTTSLTQGRALTPQDARYVLSPYEGRQLAMSQAPTAQDIRDYIAKNQDLLSQPGHNLGTWDNTKGDGKHYLDVSIGENDLNKALDLARQHKQLAIFDMAESKDIQTPQEVAPLDAFKERAKQGLVDGPVAALDKLHAMGVPGAAEDAARIKGENPGRFTVNAPKALAIAAPAVSSQIDDSDPNDPHQALKRYAKLGLDIAGVAGLGAAIRTNPQAPMKAASAKGAALLMLGAKKADWQKTLLEHGLEQSDLPKVRAGAQKLLEQQIAKSETGLTKVKKLLSFVETGKGDAEWYNTGDELNKYFGEDAPMVAKLIAATSNNSTVKSNLTLALKAYAQHKANPEAPIEGIMRSLLPAVDRARTGQDLGGRKVDNFAKALMGDPNAVVVDRWMMRAWGFKGDVPTPAQYDIIEHGIKELAQRHQMEPRQVQAAIWFGVKKEAEAGRNRPDSPAYGTILNGMFGQGAPVQETLQEGLQGFRANPKKGFGGSLRQAILNRQDSLPFGK